MQPPGGPSGRPSPPGAPPCRLPLARRTSAWPARASTRPATSCLLADAGDYPERHVHRHATSPTPSSSLSCLSPPLVLSPSRARAPPSPPPAVPVATETPSPLRAVHGLHLHLSRLSVSSHDAGRPASPSTLPSSSSLPQDHRRPHDLIIPSPSPLSLSSHPP